MQIYSRLKIVILFITLGVVSDVWAQVDTSYFTNLKYRSIGPSRGGRSTAVVGDLKNQNLFYMGTSGGGVWKTQNGGKSWVNISDKFFGGSVGSIAIAPSDDNVIYVGMGEESLRGNVSSGNGIWKSEDAGVSWTQKGLEGGRHITRLAVHPTNQDIAFAAVLGDLYTESTERGLYQTKDGGASWNQVLYHSDSAGFNEVIIDPLNHRHMYAASWQVRRTPYSFSSGGAGSALWRSKDGGKSWENLMSKPGMPKGMVGKMTISASAAQKNLLFASVEHATNGGLFKSIDGGETWKNVNKEGKIRQRAWYFSRVYCDTKNPQVVYVMNVHFQKSADGGKTFKTVHTPHVDHHDLWIDPINPNRMITANDGGGQVSYNGGLNWSSYHNQPTEQFYRVSVDHHVPYRIYGAQQDNSTMRIDHTTGKWESTAGGESAHIAIDPTNDEIVYAGSYGGYLTMYNHESKDSRAINVWPDNPIGYGAEGMKYRFQWNFPVFFSPHDSTKLYAASNHLHVSYNGGDSWEIISPDLSRNDSVKLVASGGPITKDNTGVEYYCTIFSAVEAENEQNVLWVGSDDGLLHISKDGGANWQNITPKYLPAWTMINSIEVDPFERGTAYIVATSYKLGDNRPYIVKVEDYGAKSTPIVAGISNDHFVRCVRADRKRKNLLYAGTERGMYISYNGGKQWQAFELNLPEVPITDMVQKDNDLVVATQGRGFWIIDQLDAVRVGQLKSITDSISLIASEGTALTPRGKATLSFYMKDSVSKKDTFFLDVLDANGQAIRTFSNQKFSKDTGAFTPLKGMNYRSWSLGYLGAKRPKGMILWWATTSGPKAKPGQYWFRTYLNGRRDSLTFHIVIDPNSNAKKSDYIAQFDFINEVVTKLDETHEALEEIVVLKAKLSGLASMYNLDKMDTITILIDSIKSQLNIIHNALYQTQNRSYQDPINFPIKLNNKLAHLNSLVRMGHYGPTQQAKAVKQELIIEINKYLAQYQAIKTVDLSDLNRLMLNRRLDFIKPE
ncbi:MAG: photosystem II stability/assembly factor-like uncharacterized protein [Bacteroidia bacterium]|jgi:photosystem II stability/assembly factor-like uncharacterized protein